MLKDDSKNNGCIIHLKISRSSGLVEIKTIATFHAKGDAAISAAALQKEAPDNFRYFLD